ncbi:MAG: oligosaccharide flippase family protein [Fibrobacteria bacterium]
MGFLFVPACGGKEVSGVVRSQGLGLKIIHLLKGLPDLVKRERAAFLFTLSNILPSLMGIAIGPVILKIVGLEEYGTLGLAAYFLGLIVTYADFGCYAHLLASFSKKDPDKNSSLAISMLLKAILLLVALAIISALALKNNRHDDLYHLLDLFLIGAFLSPLNVDWFFIARGRFGELFSARLVQNAAYLGLVLIWHAVPRQDSWILPIITGLSAAAGTGWLLKSLGIKKLQSVYEAVRKVSLPAVWVHIKRLFPMAASQLVTPYFLGYALAWYSMCTPDKRLVGEFSIPYRLAIGFSSLVGPFVHFYMPRLVATGLIPLGKILRLALSACLLFFITAIPLLWTYFRVAGIEMQRLPFAIQSFSILLLAVFFIAVRTAFVGQTLLKGRYAVYFAIHASSCLPTLVLSWIARGTIPGEAVPWLACLPDFLATLAFAWYYYIHSQRPAIAIRK